MSASSHFFGEPQITRYAENRHPDLPWGYWFTSVGEVPGEPPLVDENGREWNSLREAFWVGRLGLPMEHPKRVNDCLEFILSYLSITDGRFVEKEESVSDLFGDQAHLESFFNAFLEGAGIAERYNHGPTLEGGAVLLMLIATRTRDDADENIGLDWIAATSGLARGKELKTVADLADRRERAAARMAHRFATDTIAGKPIVKLIGLTITPEIPVRSTLWTMSFSEGYARDRFYLWLIERIDRWDAWSEMVSSQGTRALTEHFLKLAFADRFAVLG